MALTGASTQDLHRGAHATSRARQVPARRTLTPRLPPDQRSSHLLTMVFHPLIMMLLHHQVWQLPRLPMMLLLLQLCQQALLQPGPPKTLSRQRLQLRPLRGR